MRILWGIFAVLLALQITGCGTVRRTLRAGLKEELRQEIRPIVDERIETAKKDIWYDMIWKGGGSSLIALLLTLLGIRESQHKAIFKLANGKDRKPTER